MNRDDFCRLHWSYYLVLEKDFLDTERYISFDLGDNYLYDSHKTKDVPNDISNLFELIDFHTNIEVRGRQLYSITQQEIDEILAET